MKSGLDDYVIKSPQHFVRLCQAVRSVWQQHQTKAKANQLEQRLQALLNQLDVGIFRADHNGQLVDANAATLAMLGVQSLAAARAALAAQLVAIGRPANTSYTSEIELCRANAQQSLWLKVIATPSEVDGKIITDGLIEDITAQKQAEQSLGQLNQTLETQIQQRTEQLERTNEELELFAYSVSHDLRTPIRQVDGFVGLLTEALNPSTNGVEAAQQVDHYLTVLSNLAKQANMMIDALLAYSRTGRVEMVYQSVDMAGLVAQLVEQVADSELERQIRWEILALPTVACDRTLISTVWQNLIDNAVKFTKNCTDAHIQIGSTTRTIQLTNAASQQEALTEEIVFYIKDNGVGFDPKQLERMFGMFQQAHGPEIEIGMGIGLASVKRIVTRHQGSVWAESGDLAGATFYFSLPRVPAIIRPS